MWQTPDRTLRARRQRRNQTRTECAFWRIVRNRGLDGLKFRRQAPVAGVLCDFVCPEIRLVVELDGGVHALHEERDAERDARLEQAGFKVVRSSNEAFHSNPNGLLAAIRLRASELRVRPPHPSRFASHLLPRGEKD